MDKGLKRKQRAKVAKAKVLRRRVKIRSEAKKTRDAFKTERDAAKTINRHVQTVRHGDRRLTEDEIKKQLEENMKLLEGLEQEYSGLMKSREQFAQELAAQQQGEPASNWGGSAEVEWVGFENKEEREAAIKIEPDEKIVVAEPQEDFVPQEQHAGSST